MKSLMKWTGIILAGGFLLMQFSRAAKTNPQVDEARTLAARLHVPPEVQTILARSCADCHSNRTHWPWYSHVAPVSWWLTDHVKQGRRHMNFSDWARYDHADADHVLNEICLTVKQGFMPLDSYTLLHRAAVLTPQDVGTLCAWSQAERQRLATPR